MSENRVSEGVLVMLENATCVSAIDGGTPIGICAVTGATNVVATLGRTGGVVTGTARLGQCFIGVLDQDIATGAGDDGINVWVKGVFSFQLSSACTTGMIYPGSPIWADSGLVVVTPGSECDIPIGTIMRRPPTPGALTATMFTGRPYVDVKINPAVFRWTSRISPGCTASSYSAGIWPGRAYT